MSYIEKKNLLMEISRLLTLNMNAEIKLLTTQSFQLRSEILRYGSRKFDLVIVDDKQNIVLAMDLRMSAPKEALNKIKGFEHSLPFAYGLINKNLYYNILNFQEIPRAESWVKIGSLVHILKKYYPSLKTESDQKIEELEIMLNLGQLEIKENIKEIGELKSKLEFEAKRSSEKSVEIGAIRKKEETQQQYNFDKCQLLDLMLIARAKIDLPMRRGTESFMALSNGSEYRNEKSSSNNAFDFYLRFEFGVWLLKITFLGRHEEYAYTLMANGSDFYSFDESKIEFIPLSKQKREMLRYEETWILWERVMNS
jgi:hypothetical protein